MQLVQSSIRFSFNYVDAFQESNLFVAALIYDVTSGTPVFNSKVAMTHAAFGVYTGSFFGAPNASYLVISAVYTDGTYTTPDTNYAPESDEFQCFPMTVTYFIFDYTDYGQSPSLNVAAKIYDVSTGSPVFNSQVTMNHVALGCYFGFFNGVAGKTYETAKMVFTDGTFMTPAPDRAAGSDAFQAAVVGGISITNKLRSATLIGQTLNATLKESI